MRSRAALCFPLVGLAAILAHCSTQDGSPSDPSALGLQACAVDLDCGQGRHCAAAVCAIDCVTSKDCAFALPNKDSVNDLTCSPCGRCVLGPVRDSACLSAVDQPCGSDADCASALGAGYKCNAAKLCDKLCAVDADCSSDGRGWGCGAAGLCVRKCFRDADCYFHGFKYACSLPPGTDPAANAEAPNPVYGECVASPGIPGFKASEASDPPAARYQGVWGFLVVAAARTDGVPVVTRVDSFQIQQMLVKVTWSGGDLSWQEKWCSASLKNFNEDDLKVANLFTVLLPDRHIDSIDLETSHALGVPPLVAGATFRTDEIVDLRGARLANRGTDPLPTRQDPSHQYDQDRDGKPGITANVTGVFTGDLYQTQRTRIIFNVTAADENHLSGLLDTVSDASILGATSQTLINDAVTSRHPQADRTYFRALRLGDDASCLDVIRVSATDGAWLAFEPHFDPSKRP